MQNLEIKIPGTPASADTTTVPVQHTSSQFAIGWKDGLRATLIAAVAPALLEIEQIISAGQMTFNWKQLGLTALSAGIAYLLKNFFTPGQVTIKKSDLQ